MARSKPRGKKRPRRWHRGQGEADLWDASQIPDVRSGADPTKGAPTPLSNAKGRKNRGDAA